MNHNTPTTAHETVTVNSLNDIVPGFPLTPNEVLLVDKPTKETHLLIPNSIIPTAPDGPAYAVGALYVEVFEHSGDSIVVSPTVARTEEISRSKFNDLVVSETIIARDEYYTPSIANSSTATLYFDGASRGNPGPAASSHCLDINGKDTPIESGLFINEETNNVAEYVALVEGLRDARNRDVNNISIYGDSELIIKQIRGEYDCNADNLIEFHETALDLLDDFGSWTIEHVPREQNNKADSIANETLDENTP